MSTGYSIIITQDMQVVLLSFTPEPELVIASAARLSASKASAKELREKLSSEEATGFLNMLISSGHLSPFEHASFNFAIDGISRVASHQLVRHRIASYTQQSQRYVSFQEMEYITPPTVTAGGFKSKFDGIVREAHQLYQEMIEAGVPVEDARYILPNAVETRLVMTMNARELLHACSLRLCMKAQWEIREMFNRVKQEVEKVAPCLGDALKPKCYNLGYCDERESCGLFPAKGEALKTDVGSLNLEKSKRR